MTPKTKDRSDTADILFPFPSFFVSASWRVRFDMQELRRAASLTRRTGKPPTSPNGCGNTFKAASLAARVHCSLCFAPDLLVAGQVLECCLLYTYYFMRH